MQTGITKPWNWLLFPFSSIKATTYGVYAASVGYGIYHIDNESNWAKLEGGLPDTANVHRLQLEKGLLHACTNEGLYKWMGEHWENEGLASACYQYRNISGTHYAATDDGIWIRTHSQWRCLSCSGKRVYDFINLPQYLIVAHDSGIALYDQFMDDWMQYELDRRITNISVYRGHLIGVSDRGELLIGDKQGKFDRIQFGSKFIFSITAKGNKMYVSTDKGLFELVYIAERLILLSVKLGFPVTDVDIRADQLYMVTLFRGVQSMKLE